MNAGGKKYKVDDVNGQETINTNSTQYDTLNTCMCNLFIQL